MKKRYPDDQTRLRHICENQVYGLAPTEIIYQIAVNFIFGFDPDEKISRKNFKKLDALEFAKQGEKALAKKLNEVFGS